METVSISLYKFDELSKESQEVAINNWLNREEDHYPWHDENEESLKAFRDVFDLSSLRSSYWLRKPSFASAVISNSQIAELSGVRLWKYLQNNYNLEKLLGEVYPLTGFRVDDALLDPLCKFIAQPRDITFQNLIDECLNAWVEAVVRDFRSHYSQETARDYLSMHEFLESGEISS